VIEPRREALAERFEAALERIGEQFVATSPLQKAAADLAHRMNEMGVDYAIAGALALAAHGVVRATEDVDVLVTREGLERFKKEWLGRGYVEIRPGGKAVRDTTSGVKIDFLLEGDYPGDGKPKPVRFPSPAAVGVEAGRFRIVDLRPFLELKIASGLTAPHRLQDLADVLRLIAAARLPRGLGRELDPYVRAKYDELWLAAQHPEDDY
jgi:hypothetical protein